MRVPGFRADVRGSQRGRPRRRRGDRRRRAPKRAPCAHLVPETEHLGAGLGVLGELGERARGFVALHHRKHRQHLLVRHRELLLGRELAVVVVDAVRVHRVHRRHARGVAPALARLLAERRGAGLAPGRARRRRVLLAAARRDEGPPPRPPAPRGRPGPRLFSGLPSFAPVRGNERRSRRRDRSVSRGASGSSGSSSSRSSAEPASRGSSASEAGAPLACAMSRTFAEAANRSSTSTSPSSYATLDITSPPSPCWSATEPKNHSCSLRQNTATRQPTAKSPSERALTRERFGRPRGAATRAAPEPSSRPRAGWRPRRGRGRGPREGDRACGEVSRRRRLRRPWPRRPRIRRRHPATARPAGRPNSYSPPRSARPRPSRLRRPRPLRLRLRLPRGEATTVSRPPGVRRRTRRGTRRTLPCRPPRRRPTRPTPRRRRRALRRRTRRRGRPEAPPRRARRRRRRFFAAGRKPARGNGAYSNGKTSASISSRSEPRRRWRRRSRRGGRAYARDVAKRKSERRAVAIARRRLFAIVARDYSREKHIIHRASRVFVVFGSKCDDRGPTVCQCGAGTRKIGSGRGCARVRSRGARGTGRRARRSLGDVPDLRGTRARRVPRAVCAARRRCSYLPGCCC